MAETQEFEVWLAINEDGDYKIGKEASDAINDLMEDMGATAMRTVCLKAMIALPVTAEATVNVPDEAGEMVQVAA